MRIAVNTQLLLPGRLEGIGWFTWETLRRITAAHPEHEFFPIYDRPWDPALLPPGNVQPLRTLLPSRHPVLWYLRFHHEIPALLRRHRIDLYYSPDGWNVPGPFPSVVAMHDLNFQHHPENLPFFTRHYYLRHFPRYARDARRVITVSEYSKRDIADTFGVPADRIDVVYNAAGEEFRPLDPEGRRQAREEFAGGQPYFAFVGALNPRKNLIRLLQAYDRFIASTGSPVQLAVAGEAMWSDGPIQRVRDQLRHRDQVHFLGRLTRERIARFTAGAEALLLPSTFEGFGIPIVEAMHCEVPVLTSNVTSMPEIGGDAALYVDPFSVDSIADGLARIASDQALREGLVERGRERRLAFSWDRAAEGVWRSLERCL